MRYRRSARCREKALLNPLQKIIGAVEYHSQNKNLFSYLDFKLNDISVEGPDLNLSIQDIDYDKNRGTISIKPINQVIFSKSQDLKSIKSKSLIEIPEINIEHPDLILDHESVRSFGVRNILVPNVNIAIESNKKEKSGKKQEIKLAVNDSSFRNLLRKVDFVHIDSMVFNDIGISYRNLMETRRGDRKKHSHL